MFFWLNVSRHRGEHGDVPRVRGERALEPFAFGTSTMKRASAVPGVRSAIAGRAARAPPRCRPSGAPGRGGRTRRPRCRSARRRRARARSRARAAGETGTASFWSPSRGPTSTMRTEAGQGPADWAAGWVLMREYTRAEGPGYEALLALRTALHFGDSSHAINSPHFPPEVVCEHASDQDQ